MELVESKKLTWKPFRKFIREFILVFCMCVLCAFVGGAMYLFGSYVNMFKDRYDYNQTQMNLLSSFYFIGGCSMLLFLGFFDNLDLKYSTAITVTGGVLGYLIITLKLLDAITLEWFGVVFCFSLIGFYVMGLSNVMIGVVNEVFEDRRTVRDIISSLVQVFYAFANIIWPIFFDLVLNSDLNDLFIFLTLLTLICGSICTVIVYKPTEKEKQETFEEYQNLEEFSSDSSEELKKSQKKKKQKRIVRCNFFIILETFFSPLFVLIAIIFVNCGTTSNLFGNANSMIILNGGERSETTTIYFGIGQSIGRFSLVMLNLIKHLFSAWTKYNLDPKNQILNINRKKSKKIYFWLAYFGNLIGSPLVILLITSLFQFFVHLFGIFYREDVAVYIYVIVSGITYGSMWSLFYLAANHIIDSVYLELSLFWHSHSVTIFGFIAFLGCGCGAIFFSSISGAIYDYYGEDTEFGTVCTGHACFDWTFVIQCIFSLVAVILSLFLFCCIDIFRIQMNTRKIFSALCNIKFDEYYFDDEEEEDEEKRMEEMEEVGESVLLLDDKISENNIVF